MIENEFPGLSKPQVEESEISLFAGDELVQVFLCTPEALKELAVGHLYCRGLIASAGEVSGIEIPDLCSMDGQKVQVHLSKDAANNMQAPALFKIPALRDLKSQADRIRDLAGKYRIHGGVHCAVLSDGREIVALYEDVGRHNALDKAIGAALLEGKDPSQLIYFASGRINSEIAEKAAVCGFPLIVSRSIATTRACRIVQKTGCRIIGRIESDSPIMYTASVGGVQ